MEIADKGGHGCWLNYWFTERFIPLDSSDSETEEVSHGQASAGAIEAGTFDSKMYLSNSEHGCSVVSESHDLEWNVNKISSDEQEK